MILSFFGLVFGGREVDLLRCRVLEKGFEIKVWFWIC